MMSDFLYFSFHFIGKNFPLLYIILTVVGMVILIVVVVVMIVVLLCWWKRRKDKAKTVSEKTPLLKKSDQGY